MKPVSFDIDGTRFYVDVEAKNAGLLRQNAMTTYALTKPYMIEAREFNMNNQPSPILFYHVCCETHGWVQISKELGEDIIRKCTPNRFSIRNVMMVSVASSIVSGIMILRWMKTRK